MLVPGWGEAAGPAQPGHPQRFGPLSGYGVAAGPPGARGVNVSGPAHRGVLGGFLRTEVLPRPAVPQTLAG